MDFTFVLRDYFCEDMDFFSSHPEPCFIFIGNFLLPLRLESTSENATFGGLDDDCPSIPKEHGTPYPTWPRANGGVEPSGRGSGQGSGLGQPPLCVCVWLGEWGGCWGAWLRLP